MRPVRGYKRGSGKIKIFWKLRLAFLPNFSIFNWKFKAQYLSLFPCGLQDLFLESHAAPSQFEFETPGLK